ncbi:MAG: tRNA (adenosine(37)-N6)-threonylcarbamoyltransferase complex ATPase subunit type 1 TsaE [Alphaproteobacteria bacterium]|nr:tRNA (adenosine(37)-N6)-threonylcarbamoyltransferase complex ATPase subunit type 1 TsaE [Alphaproteobacteria bacterium]
MTFCLRNFILTQEGGIDLARGFASILRSGDVVSLSGELGAGKTTFARALINSLSPSGEMIEVTSPTFPIVQFYEFPGIKVAHFDFYRINDPSELEELGWYEALLSCLVLIEWPSRLVSHLLPESRLDICISSGKTSDERSFIFTGERDEWEQRLERFEEINLFLDKSGWGRASCVHLQGDASTRNFFRLENQGHRAVLMDVPGASEMPSPQELAVQDYAARVHLGTGVRSFIAVNQLLRREGFFAPEILSVDHDNFLLLVEDLGSEGIVDSATGEPIVGRYRTCVELLAEMATRDWRLHTGSAHDVEEGDDYQLPVFNRSALLTEAELTLSWFPLTFSGAPLTASACAAFSEVWESLLSLFQEGPLTLALRDFHSPNLLWQEGCEGVKRVGLIDFQDAVLSHPAYDLVSLLQDARVDIPASVEENLLFYYLSLGSFTAPQRKDFLTAYACLGAQRNCKLLGLFVRLSERDGRKAYLRHLPRVGAYLGRNFACEALFPLRSWFETHLPMVFDPVSLASGGRK